MDLKAKLRPFYVAKMLYEQTDEEHYLTIAQIMERLEKDYGISTSRGTVGDDIKALQELGVEIEVVPSTQKRFSLIGRRFDLPELKTLIDAVESARFIPEKKRAALVEKLGSLTSQHNTEKLVRNVDVENRLKADNEKIYYIMEALNDAINARKKVSFQYFTYNVRKEQKLKYDGYTYVFSPYKLIWNGDYYYVVGFSEKHKGIGSFRVDRIARCPIILDDDAVYPPKNFDLNVYLNSMFRMYNGQRKQIELVCSNDVMDAIIDKFGKDVHVLANDMNTAHIHNHIIMNSVNFKNGQKFHQSAREMQQAKEYSNQLCREYGLSFTESKADPFRIPAWKKRLCRTIKEAMENCATREEFIAFMAEYGYKVRWEPNQKYITYTTPENVRCRDNKLFDQTLLRSSMEAYFDMGGCEYLESRIDATEYGELLPTVDDAVCGLISILDAMNTGDNDRFHLETLHHSKQEIRRILERGGKIDRTVEYAVDDEEEEYEQYHGFSMRM